MCAEAGRAGATLIEVLVAIFVMGIGLLALLVLFPIGALRMAEAIRNERCAQCAVNAAAIANALDVRNDQNVVGPPNNLYVNPPGGIAAPAQAYEPSFPVFVDPFGFAAAGPNSDAQLWVGGPAARGMIPRCPASFAPSPEYRYRWFSLTDDLVFDGDTPGLAAKAGNVVRDTRYSWAYLCQRPYANEAGVVDLAVVVFNNRPLSLSNSLDLQEYPYVAYFDPSSNLVTLDYTNNVPPPVRPGDWILDASVVPGTVNNGAATFRHAYFCRVVGVNEFADANGNTYAQYEVQTPLRGWGNTTLAAGAYGYPGTVIVLSGVAEVFEKGPCRLP